LIPVGSGVMSRDSPSACKCVCELDFDTTVDDAPEFDMNPEAWKLMLLGPRLGEFRELPARLEHTLVFSLVAATSMERGRLSEGGTWDTCK